LRRRQTLAELALVGIAAVWGLTFVMVQDAIEELPTMAFLGYRFAAAALLVALVFRKRLSGLSAAGLRMGLLMGAFLTAAFVLQTLGLEETTASNTGFITGLFVVFTPLLGAIVLRERIPWAGWAAAAVSVAGLFLLSGVGELNLRGDGLVLLCAVAVAAHILATDRAVERHDVGGLLVVQLSVAAVFCTAVAALTGDLERPQGSTVWSALIVTAVVASALGFFVQTFAQRNAPPQRTALILTSEPVFAGLFGWLLAGDRLGALQWAGAGLIMAAIVASELRSAKT
jgi:drug/metabolite transporter (DMT)-like permease